MYILKPTFSQLPFGRYIILLLSYYEVQFSWQETVDMIGPHEVNLLTWCITIALITLMQIITKDPLLKPSQLCNCTLVGHSDVIISLWRDQALQCTFLSIVLETTLAKEMHMNTIGALYRPYNIFSDFQENIDHHSQPTLGEKITVCTILPSSLPYQQIPIPCRALTLSLVTFAHAQNSFTSISVHTICVLDELLHPHIDALRTDKPTNR